MKICENFEYSEAVELLRSKILNTQFMKSHRNDGKGSRTIASVQ